MNIITESIYNIRIFFTHKAKSPFSGVNVSELTYERVTKMGQEMLENINKKRDDDECMHEQFRATLALWSEEFTKRVISDMMQRKYAKYSKRIAELLAVIKNDFERVEQAESELNKIANQVEELYNMIGKK